MQISSKVPGSFSNTSLFQAEKKQAGQRMAQATLDTGTNDSVTLSSNALLLSEATRTAQSTADVRQERVDALRIQIQNGTYQPDSQLIAQNLVREEADLFLR